MIALYMIFICFLVLPVASALLMLASVKHGLITTTHKNRLTGKAKSLKPETYSAGVVVISIALLIILAGYNAAGGNAPGWLVGVNFTLVVLSTLTLSIILLKATKIYALSPTSFKWLGSLISLLIVYVSSVYADTFIAQALALTGSELVATQRVLTILFLPIVCAFLLSGAMLPLYGIAGLLWLWHTFTDQSAEQQRLRFLMLGPKDSPRKTKNADIYMVLFVSLAFSTLIPLNAVGIVTKDHAMDRLANKSIVWASFHLKKHQCYPDAPEGTVFGLIDSTRVAAATPNETFAYTFQVQRCDQP